MKPFVLPIDITPEEAFLALHKFPYSLWLDSADKNHPAARYSFIAALPVESIEAKDGRVTVTNAAQQTTMDGDPFAILKERLAVWDTGADTIEGLPPFQGGLAGLFGYDLAGVIEKLPPQTTSNPHRPDMAVGIYDQVIAFDHAQGKAWIITRAPDERTAKLKQARLLGILHNHNNVLHENPPLRWTAQETPEAYMAKIARVIEYIHAGDIFQANLSQRFDAVLPPAFDSFAHYMALREINPAPFACYMNLGGMIISSASPEQFLRVENGHVSTRPIKGTRARGHNKAEDEKNRAELLTSAKDRAENIMIVDLLRNDLSKVCRPSSVEVTKLCALESFAGVHHLVSTVEGELRETAQTAPIDLLKACFPGGSITGAPKIRSMEILGELEPAPRGAYCGSVGYIGFDGAMDSNILIRTLVYEGNRVSLQAGGGITADSIPEDEFEESLAKADRVLESFTRKKTRGAA